MGMVHRLFSSRPILFSTFEVDEVLFTRQTSLFVAIAKR
jgi:hypothetical protein